MNSRTASVPPSNPWVVLAMLLAIYIFNFADRYLITGLIGPIKAEFGLGDGMMGLLMGPAFVVLYVVLGVPFARMADRGSRIRIIAAGCVLWSGATVATGLATGPISLALARVGVGVGEAAFVAPAYSLLSDYFRPEKRGFAFALLGLATYFGQIAGQGGGPAIAAVHGWRLAFIGMGVAGVALGVLALWLIREPVRTKLAEDGVMPFGRLVALLLRRPAFLLMALTFGLAALSGVAFSYWGPELFARRYGLDPVTAKSAFALNFGLSGLIGTLLFGALADRLSARSMIWPSRLSALAIGAATAAILAATWADSFTLARWLAVPAGLLGGGWPVGLLATLQYMLPASIRASSTALFLAATTLLGYFVAPWATGAISGWLGNDGHSLAIALSLIIPFGFLASALGWLAGARLERDRQALAQAPFPSAGHCAMEPA
ncbi:MFS transporter [Sphingobium sp. EM0848]|uniref:spinster family MFS transporter n=1 Tax=Sphingobium sp. EM0848 TaxID=2743473 RepID=UPI00159C9106|nr:MFS transporter [Sphingobium sp. EM0848]